LNKFQDEDDCGMTAVGSRTWDRNRSRLVRGTTNHVAIKNSSMSTH